MKANEVSDFLGVTSDRIQNRQFTVSIVTYDQFVSEDWHYHENIHLSSILTGGNFESRKSGDFDVAPGSIMAYQGGEIHRNRNTLFPSKNLNIELKTDFFNDEIQFSNLQQDSNTYLELLKIYYELILNDDYSNQSIQQILKSFFYLEKSTTKPDWVDRLKTLLNDRWQEFISLDELSKELGLHPVSISKYFAKHTNHTLAEYMRKIKVSHAIHKTLNSTASLVDIAYQCGFSDQSHMNRLFKYYIGFSPRHLRTM